ncbi:MAG: CBS domain-containing protein [Proteobacteria bacterium]|nr:CBS domain-containing protein [Pseudomonadota bacterium]
MEIIVTHANADFDGIGAMIGVKKLYPDALLVFLGSQEEAVNRVVEEFSEKTTDRFYKIRDLKIEHLKKVILVDTRSPKRLGGIEEYIEKFKPEIHIFDHHAFQNGDYKGDKEFYKEVGSTVTIICEILEKSKIQISPYEATIMMAGIYEDTGMLTYSSTTSNDYKACAWLLRQGAKLEKVRELISKEASRLQIGLLNDMLNDLRIYNIYGHDIGITIASSEEFIGDFAVLVQKVKDIENLPAIFGIGRFGDRIFVSARSRIPEVNVGEILSIFGGGGHAYAASATVRDLTVFQVQELILEELKKRIEKPKVARDIMSMPVKYVTPDESIDEVKEILTKYNINMVPVCEKSKNGKAKIIGLISRQNVEKAAFHGFEKLPVKNFMTTEFYSIRPDSDINEIRELIFRGRQRLLPVVNEEGEPLGVITRTDFLRIIQDESIHEEEVGERKGEFNKNLKYLIETLFDKETQERLIKIGEIAESYGYNAFIVGGVVRDLILRKPNYDIDVVIEGDCHKMVQTLSKLLKTKVVEHRKFGTATLIFDDGKKIDLATARIEYYPSPASLPTVEWGSLKLDLYRRDFTINTLAVKLNPGSFGNLIDYFGGLRDIKDGIIRVIHNLSFVEDPTRVFRALRFEARFNFKISKHTFYLIKNAIKMNVFNLIKGPRILNEIELIFQEEEIIKIMDRIDELDLMKYIVPKVNWKEQKKLFIRAKELIRWYELLYTGINLDKSLIYFLCLFDNLDLNEASSVIKDLGMRGSISKVLLDYKKKEGMFLNSINNLKEEYEIYFLLKDLQVELSLYLMAKIDDERIKRIFSLYFTDFSKEKVSINGEDLKKLGYNPSPVFTKIFNGLMIERLKGNIKTKEQEIEWVKKHFPLQNI